MSSSVAVLAPPASVRRADPVRVARDRLTRALPARADAAVLVDLLEDDLREGLDALGDVEAHFHGLLATLQRGALSPVTLLDAGDDDRVLQRLECLHEAVTHLRRRLSQAALMMRKG
ncbi:hypothetical protein DRW03_01020 [Corallococcus sp. H22C18031201]|uniref:hypothetical protein n=1 Tax=Citreicoccus inhibens TaxID=2849499 RepID=UPI000E742AC7|nr:hypothetical protein [Citreicoccus inhibens]MBU8898268.1 hypothetical protein [Citreicoccus inhibens]RJS26997.1 hypothetical protein DRW03_01020 [Corallococcus sp. H22C18031201]